MTDKIYKPSTNLIQWTFVISEADMWGIKKWRKVCEKEQLINFQISCVTQNVAESSVLY